MINIPHECPICASNLERVNDQLYCRSDSCDAKSSKKLLHYIKTMKIKGLGEKTLEKLNIDDIPELYSLKLETLVSIVGEKVGTKIFDEIAQSKTVSLATFIQAFGVPLIGNSAATKLAKVTDSLWDLTPELCKKAGLGQKATDNLLQWIKLNVSKYSDLPITPSTTHTITETRDLFKVAITGKLNDYSSRAKAKEFLEAKGVTVLSGVSSKVNYLICETNDTNSSSYVKAKNLNIPVVTMNDILNIINGDINV